MMASNSPDGEGKVHGPVFLYVLKLNVVVRALLGVDGESTRQVLVILILDVLGHVARVVDALLEALELRRAHVIRDHEVLVVGELGQGSPSLARIP